MTQVFRHGGEVHVVRPDRVMRTSVLSPIVGYQPNADVMAVAQAFTQGPPSGTMLQGLGALDFGPIKRLGLRIKAWFAQAKAGRFAAVAATDNQMASPTPAPAGAAPVFTAQVVAPQTHQEMAMVNKIIHRADAGQYGAYVVAGRRYNMYYRAG